MPGLEVNNLFNRGAASKGLCRNPKEVYPGKPLRVCFVFASKSIGGAERSMLRLMQYAHPFQLNCCVVICRTGPTPLMEAVQGVGIPVMHLKTMAFTSLAHSLRHNAPDVVYLFGQVRSLLWGLAARHAGIPACIGAERGSGTRWINSWGRRFDQWFLHGYITNSQNTASVMIREMGISEQRIAVVYNGVDEPKKAPPQTDPHLQWGCPSVVCVANLLPNKGQIVLLRAVRLLRGDYPFLRAMLVGNDMTGGEFMNRARGEGLEETFSWAGFVPDVRGFLRRADMFVLPTLFREGIPTSLLEAMLERLPVIATNVGGVAELINHGQNGLLVEPNQPVQIAEALRKILTSPAWGKSLGEAGRDFVLRHFSMENMIKGHVNAFLRFLGGQIHPEEAL